MQKNWYKSISASKPVFERVLSIDYCEESNKQNRIYYLFSSNSFLLFWHHYSFYIKSVLIDYIDFVQYLKLKKWQNGWKYWPYVSVEKVLTGVELLGIYRATLWRRVKEQYIMGEKIKMICPRLWLSIKKWDISAEDTPSYMSYKFINLLNHFRK